MASGLAPKLPENAQINELCIHGRHLTDMAGELLDEGRTLEVRSYPIAIEKTFNRILNLNRKRPETYVRHLLSAFLFGIIAGMLILLHWPF